MILKDNMTTYKLDPTDRQIIDIIQHNSRVSIKEIASQLHLSTTPIFDRMKKMEKAGVIKGFVALIDQKKVDKALTVFINIAIKEHGKKAITFYLQIH